MPKQLKIIFLSTTLLIFLFCFSAILFEPGKVFSSQANSPIPALKNGDTWEVEISGEGSLKKFLFTVVNDNYSDTTYLIRNFVYLKTSNIPTKTMLVKEKETLNDLKLDIYESQNQNVLESTINFKYEDLSEPCYPFKVGKTCKSKISKEIIKNINGISTSNRDTSIEYYIVESFEKVKVPAGIFDCFKIKTFNQNKFLSDTCWVSEKTKYQAVKGIDHKNNWTYELSRYNFGE